MSKRAATTLLTRDNWDDEEEEKEDPGQFTTASSDQIAQRKMRVAKRRLGAQEGNKAAGGSVFGSFSGFGAKPATTTAASTSASTASSLFPGLSFAPKLPSAQTANSPQAPSSSLSFSLTTTKLPELVDQPPKTSQAPVSTNSGVIPSTPAAEPPEEFCAELKALNENVIAWLHENFQEDPHVNFAPVFDDYKKHFSDLEQKYRWKTTAKEDSSVNNDLTRRTNGSETTTTNGASTNATLNFGFTTTAPAPAPAPAMAMASINSTTAPSVGSPFKLPFPSLASSASVTKSSSSPSLTASLSSAPKPFSFGLSSAVKDSGLTATSTGSSTFSFGNYTKSTFSFSAKAAEKKAGTDDKDAGAGSDDDEYEPPKAERAEQVEEDAYYTVRCKLFYKKDGKFVEKGVGSLFLKPLDGGQKTQLLIRADTTLGTVLLNLALNESMPCSRSGKNNVTMVCVPNPPLDPKAPSKDPAVLLIRVKTSEEADNLLEELNKAKSKP